MDRLNEIYAKHLEPLVAQWGVKVLAALAILVLGMWGAKLLAAMFRRMLGRKHLDPTLIGFLANLMQMGLVVLVVIAALEAIGVNTTSFAAILAAAGLAVGLALQGSLSNFAAGVMLVVFRPFKVDDLVQAGGEFGTVKEVQLFCTVLVRPDGKRVIVPNGGITGGNIVNWTAEGRVRVEMTFGISYDDDFEAAKAIIREILDSDARVLKDPGHTVRMKGHGDSSIDIACMPWCAPGDYWGVWFDTHEKVKRAFDDKGITIPFPQRDVHMFPASAA